MSGIEVVGCAGAVHLSIRTEKHCSHLSFAWTRTHRMQCHAHNPASTVAILLDNLPIFISEYSTLIGRWCKIWPVWSPISGFKIMHVFWGIGCHDGEHGAHFVDGRCYQSSAICGTVADAAEERERSEWSRRARKELEDWYKHHAEQVEKAKENNRCLFFALEHVMWTRFCVRLMVQWLYVCMRVPSQFTLRLDRFDFCKLIASLWNSIFVKSCKFKFARTPEVLRKLKIQLCFEYFG